MELLQRDVNIIADRAEKDRLKKRNAMDRVVAAIQSGQVQAERTTLELVTRTCVRALDDPAEALRTRSVAALRLLLPALDTEEGPVWVLPPVAARMNARGDSAEPSEQLRMELLQLAVAAAQQWRHDIGPKGFLGTLVDIVAAALADKFPDLLKAACTACQLLCDMEPKGMKNYALGLAKGVKQYALQHKHSVVRTEGVKAFAALIARGAVEILGDMRDEQDNRTSVYYLYVLAHDHSESVRGATLAALSAMLLDITDRLEQQRRLVSIVLGYLADPAEDLRAAALALIESLGKQYMLDNEDNRIDFAQRRVTGKDIETYMEDAPLDMSLASLALIPNQAVNSPMPDLSQRPSIGARMVVRENVRHFLTNLLADATAVDWLIPYSNDSKRIVALRVLKFSVWYCEADMVQHAQPVLAALFKALLNEDALTRQEATVCVELLGKYLEPRAYLPILLRREPKSADAAEVHHADSMRLSKTAGKTFVATVEDAATAGAIQPLPTLFSAAATTTKTGILVALRYLLRGTTRSLTQADAKQLVVAVSDPDLMDIDTPALVRALGDAVLALVEVLAAREFVPTPSKPLPADQLSSVSTRTLDSMLMYVLLRGLACEEAATAAHLRGLIRAASTVVSGTERGWFAMHSARILHAQARVMPPEALQELLDNTPDLTPLAAPLTQLFVARLAGVNYQLRVVAELRLFTLLRRVLAAHAPTAGSASADGAAVTASHIQTVELTTAQVRELVEAVVLPHLRYTPGPTPHLFRKVGLTCLKELMRPDRRRPLIAALQREAADREAPAGPVSQLVTPTTEEISNAWLRATDHDDAEVRLTCMELAYDMCVLPLTQELASGAVKAVLGRLDDSSDAIRVTAMRQLLRVLTTNEDDVHPALVVQVRGDLASIVKVLVLHLDDQHERVGLREVIVQLLKRLCGMDRALVHGALRDARTKHATTRYIDEVLEFTPQ